MELGYPLAKRFEVLETAPDGAHHGTHLQKFKGELLQLPMGMVPIGLPKYRLANGRTQAAQEQWVAEHPGVGRDIFTRDEESIEAQTAQHKILSRMLKDRDQDLLVYFRKNEQTEPLLLTSKGFVLNGNRRLCAMRKLYDQDHKICSNFKFIRVAILPECEQRDLDEIEAELQIHTDIKASYSWISEACMHRHRRETHKYSDADIERIYEMDLKDVKQLREMLAEVDRYLLTQKHSQEYDRVEKMELTFRKIVSSRKKLKGEAKKDIFRSIAYVLLENPDEAGLGRLYDAVPDVASSLNSIIKELEKELDVPEDTDTGGKDALGESEDLLIPLAREVRKDSNKEQVLTVVRDTVEADRELKKTKKKANFVFVAVKQANTKLQSAISGINSSVSKDGVAEQLSSIAEAVERLREWLNDDA